MNFQNILHADNASYKEFDDFLRKSRIQKIFLVCGNSSKQLDIGKHIRNLPSKLGIGVEYFSEYTPNPDLNSVMRGIEQFKKSDADLIVALGGGSAIDVAKCIKIWPYFTLLCALDFVISPSKESLFEVFANLTLCQGLLPNAKISVIGVSWTLAVIFVFYMLFPFFCFLIGNKKRAWSVAVVALVFNWLCTNYFKAGRTNIVYDAIYFIAGGLIFLYRKELAEFAAKYKVVAGAILLIATVAYFALGDNTLTMLFFCVAALVYTLGCKRGGTGQSSRQVPRWYQLRDLPVPHDNLSGA